MRILVVVMENTIPNTNSKEIIMILRKLIVIIV